MKKKLHLFTLFILTSVFSFGQVSTAERDALIAFYNATDGENWTNNTGWNTSDPVSDWFGVTVEDKDGQDRVTGLVLNTNNLNGTIPEEIGDLLELRKLVIEFHPLLTGTIPESIGNLTYLEYLSFWDNNLTGTIPMQIGFLSFLETLSLEQNELTGNIPSSFKNLSSMGSFWIDYNNLSGDLEEDLFNDWEDLYYFSISNNNLSGDLDLSNNHDLILCWVHNTEISSLNIQNGNNSNMENGRYRALDTPNLTCVFVDNVTYSNDTWTYTDPVSTFVANQIECQSLSVSEETLKQNVVLFPNPTSGILNISIANNQIIEKVTVINSLGQKIIDTKVINTIDLSNLVKGIYMVNVISSKGEMAIYRVIKK